MPTAAVSRLLHGAGGELSGVVSGAKQHPKSKSRKKEKHPIMKKNINKNWYFRYGEEADLKETFDKTSFFPIGLPHTFDLPYYGETGFYIGFGVYKKELSFTAEDLKSDIFLEFLGVFQEAEIFLNGDAVLSHRGGYTGFTADITSAAREGTNLLTVRVNNLWHSDLPPRAGEHLFGGGIYRDVSLIFVPKAHIKWNGIFIQPKVLDGRAQIEVQVETENASGRTLCAEIFDGGGVSCGRVSGAAQPVSRLCLEIENPVLWDVDNPVLYTLECRLGEQTETIPFGIRTISFSAETGFFLNGKHLYLEGVNVHQDRGGWGDAATIEGIRRDLKMMKEAGFNFIRTSHYPRHPFFARECDRLGLLVWYEATFWGIGGFGGEGFWNASAMPTAQKDFEPFAENCMYAMKSMIRANRNSPSIIAWSVGNEIFFSQKEVLDDAKKLVQRMLDCAKELDATRPAGVGGTQRGGFHLMGDMTGFNGDGATLYKKPSIPNLVSEYGSVVANRPGTYETYYTAGVKEQYEWRCGRALWCGFHHGSIADIGRMGIVDLYRLPLRAYFCYREKLTGVGPPEFPRAAKAHHLELRADRAEIRTDGTDDTMLIVTMHDESGCRVSAGEKVVVEVIDGEGVFPTGKKWEMKSDRLSFLDGIGAIELRAYHSGRICVRASAPDVLPAEIVIMATGEKAEEGAPIRWPECPPKTFLTTEQGTDLVLNRPVWASSEAEDHPGCMVSDGSSTTFWCPSEKSGAPELIMDMENIYEPECVELSLDETRTRVTVAVSADRQNWTQVYRTRWMKKRFTGKKLKLKKAPGRYLRLTFENPKVRVYRVRAFLNR